MPAIPKTINQIWISPNDSMLDMPVDVYNNTCQWKHHHKDFSHKIWTLDEVKSLALECSFGDYTGKDIVNLFNSCRFPAMKADLARLLILYNFGGIWIDLKLVPKRPFLGELLSYNLVLVEHHKTAQYPDPAKFGLLNNCFFACLPQSAFLAEVALLALHNVKNRVSSVWNATGPRTFMTIFEKRFVKTSLDQYPELKLFRESEFMEVLVGWGWSSYNKDGMHWSERSKGESIYC